MTQPHLALALAGATPSLPLLAEVPGHVFDGWAIGAAILLTLVGVALNWNLPRRRMSVEEHVKDGDMTEEQARRHLRFYERFAPVVTLVGVAVLIYVLFDLTR